MYQVYKSVVNAIIAVDVSLGLPHPGQRPESSDRRALEYTFRVPCFMIAMAASFEV